MEMVRESRERDKESGVDRSACIVDRNQFFNTQVRLERELVGTYGVQGGIRRVGLMPAAAPRMPTKNRKICGAASAVVVL